MKVKALVIDDSRVMRNMVMQSLRQSGLADFEFTEAEDGADGLGKFNPKNTDIIFVDWNMPRMTGIDFVRKVRGNQNAAHVPIVMVTSEKSVGKIEDALDQAGADAYITKPFTSDILKKELDRIIARVGEGKSAAPAAKPGGGFFSKLLGS